MLQLQDETFLKVIRDLSGWYQGFRWESQVWAEVGLRRSPYRALILFGLSPRTSEGLLVKTSGRLLKEFPELQNLIQYWQLLQWLLVQFL